MSHIHFSLIDTTAWCGRPHDSHFIEGEAEAHLDRGLGQGHSPEGLTASLLTMKPSPLPTFQGFSLLRGHPLLSPMAPALAARWAWGGSRAAVGAARCEHGVFSSQTTPSRALPGWSSCRPGWRAGHPSPTRQSVRTLRPRPLRERTWPPAPLLRIPLPPPPPPPGPCSLSHLHAQKSPVKVSNPHRGQQTPARRPKTTCSLLLYSP